MEKTGEPSFWRNPAIYIGLVTVLALVVVFLKATWPSGSAGLPPVKPESVEQQPAIRATTKPPQAPIQGASAEAKTAPVVPQTSAPPQAQVGETPQQQIDRLVGKGPGETLLDQIDRVLAASIKPLTPESLYAMASPAVVQLSALNYKSEEVGRGTGFFVCFRADGWLVTNHHVIKDAKYVRITTADGRSLRADSILAWDEKADLAVLATGTASPLDPLDEILRMGLALAPAKYAPPVGSKVWAIGNPQGLANSLSEGIVSGLRSDEGVTQIQCTAAVSPGSSGGPLLDCRGLVLGVMTSIHTDTERLSQNLNFAVSSDAVRSLLARAASAAPRPVGAARTSVDVEELLAEARAEAERNPASAALRCQMGKWLNVLRRWTEAREAYRKALELDPKITHAFFGLAQAQWNLGDYAGVDQSLRCAEAVEPDAVKYRVGLGGFYSETSRYEQAIRVFQEAIGLDPRSTGARVGLIFTLMNRGQFAEALLQCEEWERLDPAQGRSWRTVVIEAMRKAGR